MGRELVWDSEKGEWVEKEEYLQRQRVRDEVRRLLQELLQTLEREYEVEFTIKLPTGQTMTVKAKLKKVSQ